MLILFSSLLMSSSPPFCPLHPPSPHPKHKYKQGLWPRHKAGDQLNSCLITRQALTVATSRTQSLRKLGSGSPVPLTILRTGAKEKARGNELLAGLHVLFLQNGVLPPGASLQRFCLAGFLCNLLQNFFLPDVFSWSPPQCQ